MRPFGVITVIQEPNLTQNGIQATSFSSKVATFQSDADALYSYGHLALLSNGMCFIAKIPHEVNQ